VNTLLIAILLIAAPTVKPTLTPIDEAGYSALVQQHAGKVILMDIWAAWCEPCRAETPALVKLSKQLGPRGLDYVTVTLDSPGELSYAEKFLHRNLVPFPAYYRKTENEDTWVHNVNPQWTGTLPALFLYDRKGRLAKSFIGSAPPDVIESAIRELLGR
jgi:thiol-disulfide isomerase/thioredoxin